MGQHDGFAVGALDHRGHDVALVDLSVRQRGIRAMLHQPLVQAAGLAGHAGQGDHAVAAVDVEVVGDGAQLVGGIQLAVAMEEVVLAIVAVDVAVAHLVAKVVGIRAGAVHHRAEHVLMDHVQQRQLGLAVAAVLQQHDGNAGFLAGMHQLPALVDGCAAADLHGRALAGADGLNGQRDVGLPAGHDDHRVHVAAVDAFVGVRGAEGGLAAGVGHGLLRALHAVGVYVAHRGDFHVGHVQQHLELGIAAAAEAEDAQTDGFSELIELHGTFPPEE